MITSPEYKAKTRANKVAALETAALPVAMTNLKKIYDAGILVALGTDSGASPVRVQGFAEHKRDSRLYRRSPWPLRTQRSYSGLRTTTGRWSPGKGEFHSAGERPVTGHS
jgi:cytosine/adenosine deaminase-related metal-dependent hydrolase